MPGRPLQSFLERGMQKARKKRRQKEEGLHFQVQVLLTSKKQIKKVLAFRGGGGGVQKGLHFQKVRGMWCHPPPPPDRHISLYLMMILNLATELWMWHFTLRKIYDLIFYLILHYFMCHVFLIWIIKSAWDKLLSVNWSIIILYCNKTDFPYL